MQELKAAKGLRGAKGTHERSYVKYDISKPPVGHRRPRPVGDDPLEMRAQQGITGSVLERIVFKRLSVLLGPMGINWIYKYQIGAAAGVFDARAFVGGIEMDFVYLAHPSKQQMDIEVQGAQWHRDIEGYADMDRALQILQSGRLYEEVWEYEIMMGDEYLDQRILDITQFTGRIPERKETGFPEIRRFAPDESKRTRTAR